MLYYIRFKTSQWIVKDYKSIQQAKLTENANRTIDRIRPATAEEIDYFREQKEKVTL